MLYSKYTISANKYKYLPFEQMLRWELHVNRKELLKNWNAYLVIFIQCKVNSRLKKLFKFGQIDQEDPQTEFHFGTQRTESFVFHTLLSFEIHEQKIGFRFHQTIT